MCTPATQETPSVSCIIVNWNGWRDTVSCLNALSLCTYHNLSLVVVDNGSSDDSVERIRKAHPEVLLLESPNNLGFAGGNNIGIRYALAHGIDYVWLLNNDTQPDPAALSALISKISTDERIGAVASICYYAGSPSVVQAWAGASVNLWIGYARNSTTPQADDWFDSLYGASMLIASNAIRDVGMLDEGFFHSWEETEFCVRLRKRGWKLAAAPNSQVLHKVGASTGGNRLIIDRYYTTSGLRILRLHSKKPRLAMLVFLGTRMIRRVFRFSIPQCKSVWDGLRDYLRTLPITPKIR